MSWLDRIPRWVGTATIAFGVLVYGAFAVLMLVDGVIGRGLAQLGVAILVVTSGLTIRRRDHLTADS